MARSSLPQIKTPLPPEGGTGKMSRLIAEVRWMLLLAICLGLFAVLITYTKSDPAWSHASFEAPKNIGGRIGAWTADLMLYIFGVSAFWWVILFARRVYQGWRELWSVPLPVDPEAKPESFWTRWLGFTLTLTCSMGLESIRMHSLQWELPRPPGGILGEVIGDPLQMAFGFTGATLILIFGLAVGLSLFLHFSWLTLAEQVGRYVELGVRRLREKREAQEDQKIGEQAAVEREEHVEEVRIREEVAPKVQIFNQPLKTESGISTKSGCCFSRSTRSLFTILSVRSNNRSLWKYRTRSCHHSHFWTPFLRRKKRFLRRPWSSPHD